LKYDIVVVGGGPAGSVAAKKGAENGADVLLIEKHPSIGSPVHCAEALPQQILKELDLELAPRCIVNETKGANIYTSSGEKIPLRAREGGQVYILDRRVFDKFLAMDAARAGADIMVRTRATGVIKEGKFVRGVTAVSDGNKVEVKADIVIAADGVESMVARWAGLDTSIKLDDFCSGYQYEMVEVQLDEPDMMEVYYGREVAPGGYAWIFPKGIDMANVGVGIRGKSGRRAKEYLDSFVKNQSCLSKAKIIEVKVGGVPVGGPIDKFVLDGLIVIGTAAHLINPMTGGGIAWAMGSGMIAGEVASQAVKEGRYDAKRLHEYQTRFNKAHGKKLRNILRFRKALDKMSDEEGDAIIRLFPRASQKVSYLDKIGFIIKNAPKLARFFREFLF